MKFLKSQGIVLVLAVVAVFLVGKNLLWPFLKPKFASRPKVPEPPATPAPSPAAPQTQTQTQTQTTSPQGPMKQVVTAATDKLKEIVSLVTGQATVTTNQSEPMNRQALQAQSSAWTSSPQRDPFKMRGRVSEKPAKDQLTLTAILRQTYSDLAVINNQIIGKGETILGFEVQSVEADRVWVSGPNGKEALEFKYFVEGPKPQEKTDTHPATLPAQPARPLPEARDKETNAASDSDRSADGAFLESEEGSFWGASPFEAFESILSPPVLNLTHLEDHPFYLHELINHDDNQVVSATLLPD